MKKKNRLLIAFALGSIMTTGYALACPDSAKGYCPEGESAFTGRPGPGFGAPGGFEMGHGAPMMRLVKRLDLTQDQDAKIRTILKEEAPAFKREINQKRAHRAAIHDLFEAKTFDEARARNIVRDESRQMMDMRIGMLKTEYKIYQVLTPEQRDRLDKMLAEGPREPGLRSGSMGTDVPPPPNM